MKSLVHDFFLVCRNMNQGEGIFPWSFICITGSHSGFLGTQRSFIRASFGVRPPFFRLHGPQQHTMFSHVVFPSLLRGRIWSSVASLALSSSPQYWHWKLSLARMLLRLSGGERRPTLKNFNNRTTLGALIAIDTDRMWWSYSSMTSTLPRKNMPMAFCHEITRKGS